MGRGTHRGGHRAPTARDPPGGRGALQGTGHPPRGTHRGEPGAHPGDGAPSRGTGRPEPALHPGRKHARHTSRRGRQERRAARGGRGAPLGLGAAAGAPTRPGHAEAPPEAPEAPGGRGCLPRPQPRRGQRAPGPPRTPGVSAGRAGRPGPARPPPASSGLRAAPCGPRGPSPPRTHRGRPAPAPGRRRRGRSRRAGSSGRGDLAGQQTATVGGRGSTEAPGPSGALATARQPPAPRGAASEQATGRLRPARGTRPQSLLLGAPSAGQTRCTCRNRLGSPEPGICERGQLVARTLGPAEGTARDEKPGTRAEPSPGPQGFVTSSAPQRPPRAGRQECPLVRGLRPGSASALGEKPSLDR